MFVDLRELAKEIITLEIDKTNSLEDIRNRYYAILEKYNIKYGEKTEVGFSGANWEWTACEEIFLNTIKNWFFYNQLKGDLPIPKNLLY